jgi:predicted  nucleic acid-binding Zn-ribbon protein
MIETKRFKQWKEAQQELRQRIKAKQEEEERRKRPPLWYNGSASDTPDVSGHEHGGGGRACRRDTTQVIEEEPEDVEQPVQSSWPENPQWTRDRLDGVTRTLEHDEDSARMREEYKEALEKVARERDVWKAKFEELRQQGSGSQRPVPDITMDGDPAGLHGLLSSARPTVDFRRVQTDIDTSDDSEASSPPYRFISREAATDSTDQTEYGYGTEGSAHNGEETPRVPGAGDEGSAHNGDETPRVPDTGEARDQRRENKVLRAHLSHSRIWHYQTQKQFNQLEREVWEVIGDMATWLPAFRRWKSLEDQEKVTRAMDRLHNDIAAMAEARRRNPEALDSYLDKPEDSEEYPEDIFLVRKKVAETLQEDVLQLLEMDVHIDELELNSDNLAQELAALGYHIQEAQKAFEREKREQEEEYQKEIEKLEGALRSCMNGLSSQVNQEDSKAKDDWEKQYEDLRASKSELQEKCEHLETQLEDWATWVKQCNQELEEAKQQRLDEKAALLRAHEQELNENHTEWSGKKKSLEMEISELQQEKERLSRQIAEQVSISCEKLQAGKDANARLRHELDDAIREKKRLLAEIEELGRLFREASLLPPYQTNGDGRPRYESVVEIEWRAAQLDRIKARQRIEREAQEREKVRLEKLRERRMGKKYPPAQQRWQRLVAMSVDERWSSDEEFL